MKRLIILFSFIISYSLAMDQEETSLGKRKRDAMLPESKLSRTQFQFSALFPELQEEIIKKSISSSVGPSGNPIELKKTFTIISEFRIPGILKYLKQLYAKKGYGNLYLLSDASRLGFDDLVFSPTKTSLLDLMGVNRVLDSNGTRPILFLANNKKFDLLKQLLTRPDIEPNATNSKGQTSLMLAIEKSNNTESVAELLKDPRIRTNIDLKDEDGLTALAHASYNGENKTVKALLDNGANIDEPDIDGITPLMHAAASGHVNAVETLLKHGANPNHQDNYGNTALIVADGIRGNDKVIEALLAYEADPTIKNNDGDRALSVYIGFESDTSGMSETDDDSVSTIEYSPDDAE